MKSKTIERCPFCGKKSYSHQTKLMVIPYKTKKLKVLQPGYWCDECGEGVIGGKDRVATVKELQTQCAIIDGLHTPDGIKHIREKLQLTQRKAGDLFGGGVNAFSRYERGETPPPKPLSQLLQLLDAHPDLLKELTTKKAI